MAIETVKVMCVSIRICLCVGVSTGLWFSLGIPLSISIYRVDMAVGVSMAITKVSMAIGEVSMSITSVSMAIGNVSMTIPSLSSGFRLRCGLRQDCGQEAENSDSLEIVVMEQGKEDERVNICEAN